ncbi:MAG: hypothetical protein ACXQTN_01140 [Methanoculleaceae archaeon]
MNIIMTLLPGSGSIVAITRHIPEAINGIAITATPVPPGAVAGTPVVMSPACCPETASPDSLPAPSWKRPFYRYHRGKPLRGRSHENPDPGVDHHDGADRAGSANHLFPPGARGFFRIHR